MKTAILFFILGFTAIFLYFFVKKRIHFKKYIILNLLRVSSIALLVWLLTNPTVTVKKTFMKSDKVYLLIDNSQSMSIKDQNKKSRIDEINTFIYSPSGLIYQFKKNKTDFEIISMGDKLIRAITNPVEPKSPQSNIATLTDEFFSELKGETPSEIYLLSDGRATEDINPNSINYPYPVNTVAIGNTGTQTDLMVKSVSGPAYAEVEQKIDFKLKIGGTKIPAGTKIKIQRTGENENVISEQIVTEYENETFIFSFTPKKIGLGIYSFKVSADNLTEAYTENNSKKIGVPARKNFIKITVAGKPSWDLSFVIRSLKEIKNAKVTVYSLIKNETFYCAETNSNITSEDITESLSGQDIFILSDINAALFKPQDLERIINFVKNKGGGMLFLGGPNSLGSGGYSQPPINGIIPLELIENDFTIKPVKADFAVSAKALVPLFGKIDFSTLPPLEGLNISFKTKPGADLLLIGKSPRGENIPLFSIMNAGAGKSAVFSGRGFYRWNLESAKNPQDENPIPLLIKNIVSWIAAPPEDPFIHINMAKINYQLGEKANIETVVLDRTFQPAKNPSVRGRITEPGGKTYPLEFLPELKENASFYSSYLPPQPGKYTLEIEGIRAKNDISKAKTEFVVHTSSDEFKYLNADWDFLKDMAGISGGKFLTFEDFKTKAGEIKSKKTKQQVPVTNLIIDYPYILLIIAALFTIEWIIRIKEGLN